MFDKTHHENRSLIIWIDQRIDNNENQKYLKKLRGDNDETSHTYDNSSNYIYTYKDVKTAINFIKTLRFEETIIIVSGSFFVEFIDVFKKNINDIYIIPKIIVFTSKGRKFPDDIMKNEKFYYYGGIKTSFGEIKYFIDIQKKKQDKNVTFPVEKNQITQYNKNPQFVLIERELDLILPSVYKKIIDLSETKNNIQFIQNMYIKYKDNPQYNYLLNPIVTNSNVPIELLSKYYARMYTIQGDFYQTINNDLKTDYNSNNLIYQPYIKTLYEGVKKGALKTCIGTELYSSLLLSEYEIQDLMNYSQRRNAYKPIIFSKSFISFSKDIYMVETFAKNVKKNTMLTIIKMNTENDLNTHADMEMISPFKEKEVLFFPFSAFEIADMEYDKMNDRYNIKLIYLGIINNFKMDKKVDMEYLKTLMEKTGVIKIDNLTKKDLLSKNDSCCCLCCC